MSKIKVIIERTRTGFSAYHPRYPVFTTGLSRQVIKLNMVHALNMFYKRKRVNYKDILLITK